MFDGYQILTITNKIKSADIGGFSKELTERKGTGNYDKEITKSNLNKDKELRQKDITINSKQDYIDPLNNELKKLKSGKTFKEQENTICKQKIIIDDQKT